MTDHKSICGAHLDKIKHTYNLQAHSSVERAALICHLNIRTLETDEKFALRGITLQKAIKKDREKGLIPFFVSLLYIHVLWSKRVHNTFS